METQIIKHSAKIWKKIDLAKCVNCRFRAKDEDGDIAGRIKISERGTVYLFVDGQGNKGFLADRMQKMGITDFEIVPRDPETYKDWQVGDKVCEDEHRNACYEVIFRSGELVVFKDWNNWASNPMTCSEAFTRFGMRLVLTDIERQIIEEKKKYEPQDGDIVAWKDKEDDGDSAITIYRGNHRGYFTMFINGKSMGDNKYNSTLSMNVLRPATDEEKQKLFDAMAKQGKRWNAEKKVVEDIPKPYEFKKGEPVLVRGDEFHRWIIAAYVDKDKLGFIANAGVSVIHWKYCLPYNERTMHLLGTTEDYKEE